MGIPPSHSKNPLNGLRNIASFPIQYILALRTNMMNKAYGRSQFDVCGAPIKINFGITGNRPSIRHPAILKKNIENQRTSVFKTGVSKIVKSNSFFLVTAFLITPLFHGPYFVKSGLRKKTIGTFLGRLFPIVDVTAHSTPPRRFYLPVGV